MKMVNLQKITFTAFTFLLAASASAQINLSGGTYSQNFDTLSNTGTSNPWSDNSTILGWYAGRDGGSGGTGPFSTYRASTGSDTAGAIYSYGSSGSTERCLGSLASGATGTNAFGIRFVNDTGTGQTNFTVSFTGEQWRSGGNTAQQTLLFSYRVDNVAITDLDPRDTTTTWTYVPALNFTSPTPTASGLTLDGNASTNRQVFSNIVIPGLALTPGQEVVLRWTDINDAGNDHGMGIDDLTVSFVPATIVTTPPDITTQPSHVTIGEGGSATFSITATGTQPITYQWYITNANGVFPISGAVNTSVTTNLVSEELSGSGFYVVAQNNYGSDTSDIAILTVTNVVPFATNIQYLHTLHNANYVLTNTSTLFEVEGIVTSHANLVTGVSVYSFHIQDATGGIDVFNRGGYGPVPPAGCKVRVTAPLAQFNGLLELLPVVANPTHNIEVLDDGTIYPLPAPFHFTFNSINPAVMEHTFEGAYVVVSNVFLGATNASGTFSAAGTVFMTNLTGQVFPLYVPAGAIDPQGQTVPSFAKSVRGVMSQSTGSAIPTNGYSIMLTLYSEVEAGTPPEPSVSLTVVRAGSNVQLSWPTSAGYVLEATAQLNPYNWQPVAQTPTENGGISTITISNPSGNNFYRLNRP